MFQPWVDRMMKATTAKERTAVVQELMRLTARPKDWVYQVLRDGGWSSGRKPRSDKGTTKQDLEALRIAGAMSMIGVRENGKATMPVTVITSILKQNEVPITVSNSRVRTLMKREGFDVKSQLIPAPTQGLRTLHPNHVHQADPSVALMYYTPEGHQTILHGNEVYKNKPLVMEGKEEIRLWRYVLTDHYSGSVCVRYYESKGETSANMYDFLMYAWGQKADPMYQFHGLPKMLYWDAGSANQSKAITRALTSLRVETKAHLPGQPWAKGQVEKTNHLMEAQIEARVRYEPVSTVAELNELADRLCAAYNSNTIAGYDSQITRGGQKRGSRNSLWQHIQADQLRELPDAETCRLLLTLEPQVRILDNRLWVSYSHPKAGRSMVYSLFGQPGVTVGMEVEVQPILTDNDHSIVVRFKLGDEPAALELQPMSMDQAGFATEGPILGVTYKSDPQTKVEKNTKELTSLAYGSVAPKKGTVPFADFNNGEGLKAHSFIKTDGWAHMDIKPASKVGTPVEVTSADVVRPEEMTHTATEAMIKIKARVDPEPMPEGYLRWLKANYPTGVTSSDIELLVEELRPKTDLPIHPINLKEARNA